MTTYSVATAFLKPLSPPLMMQPYPLPLSAEAVMGQDPSCQIIIDSPVYPGVSKLHASIRPTAEPGMFEICDLGSASGVYINGQRFDSCQKLYGGERISLGFDGPEFLFESSVLSPKI